MKSHLLCFTQDLRLSDNPLLAQASADAESLLAVYIWPPQQTTRWGCPRLGPARERFIWRQLHDLRQQLRQTGNDLLVYRGQFAQVVAAIVADYQIETIFIEQQFATEEMQALQRLTEFGLTVQTDWQSGLYSHHYWQNLPTTKSGQSLIFTEFRRHIEAENWPIQAPISAPTLLPPAPAGSLARPLLTGASTYLIDPEDWPYADQAHATDLNLLRVQPATRAEEFDFYCDSASAWRRIEQYFEQGHGHHYKLSRDQLAGANSSSRWSAWLAQGVFSARQLMARVRLAEQQQGANSSTYWLWFELLWRDYFRYLQAQVGARFFYASGLRQAETIAPPSFDTARFARWCQGQTGVDLVDAGMRELNQTGYCSNRMRQILASFWLNELQGDWRAGAAWFEYQLIDYDVYSNYGNWLYLAGLGTDPRGGRHFNIERQITQFDADGRYRDYWLGTEFNYHSQERG